ncbi:ABC transporter permease [Dactylosporangium roseum]|uniref:ABC transporter permease n=1 Tax=Dactylosporangium roseum TaxID=47989 RepID=A0ABY5ZAX9_9ACTN|nr:ABC transporter permease [Dactylosporangium roseum]UWZ39189.1 ABC transporter permease [Dactylosporangium roseum]
MSDGIRAIARIPVVGPLLARLPHLIIVVLLVSFGTFMLVQLTSGSPAAAILGPSATPEAVAQINSELGLDKPVLDQYLDWIGGVLHGDFGNALVPPYGTVASRILIALPVTIQLAVMALLIAFLVAIPAAVYAGYRPGGRVDRTLNATSIGSLAVPAFVLALVLALLLTLQVHAFPRTGWVSFTTDPLRSIWSAFLPALTLSMPMIAYFSRVLRAEIVQTLQEDFVLFARLRGLPIRTILFRYVLRPSCVSLVTISGLSLGSLLGGTVIVESIFALPGMGNLLLNAVVNSDFPLVQGGVLLISITYVAVNTVVDLSYRLIDPRMRNA